LPGVAATDSSLDNPGHLLFKLRAAQITGQQPCHEAEKKALRSNLLSPLREGFISSFLSNLCLQFPFLAELSLSISTPASSAKMAVSKDVEPWTEGAEKYRGRRLLPHVIDYYAHHEPDRVFAAISESESIASGFQDISMKTMASAVDHMAWWLARTLKGSKKRRTLAYVGAADLRYAIVLLAAIKCGWRVR
jgi:hypothetical protein